MSKFMVVLAAFGLSLFVTGQALACDTASGQVASIDTAKAMLVMQKSGCCESDSSGKLTFVLKSDTKVLVNGKVATLADLRTGDKVEIQYEKADDVTSVSATREG